MERRLTEEDRKAAYVGDGVYIITTPDGGRKIFTSDGIYITNEIYLDFQTERNLVRFLNKR